MKSMKLKIVLFGMIVLLATACNNANDKAEDAADVERKDDLGTTRQDNTEREEGNSINFEMNTDSNGNTSGKVEGDIEIE